MDLAQIDATIQRFTSAEHLLGVNLHELATDPTFQLVDSGALTGISRARVAPLRAGFDAVWPMYLAVQSALGEIRRLRGASRRLGRAERLALAELLTGYSVRLEDGTTLRLEEALSAIRDRYEPLVEAIAEISDALTHTLPRLAAYDETLRRVAADAEVLGLDAASPAGILLAKTQAAYRKLSNDASNDPLAVSVDTLAALQDAVREAASAVASARRDRDHLADDVVAAEALVDEIRELRAEAASLFDSAHVAAVSPTGLARVPDSAAIDGDRGLAAQLAAVTTNSADWQRTADALRQWGDLAERLRFQLARAVERNNAPLARRAELRGRLSGFRAKMRAKGVSDPTVMALADDIHNELFTAPCDLGRADKMLTVLADRLADA